MRKAGTVVSTPLSPALTYTYPLNKVVVDFTATAKSLQSCPTLCDPIPGILKARTRVGCHFLPQRCIKVKSESEVAQSCLTLLDPMDCSLPGSSVHGIFQARVLEWGAIAFSYLKIEKAFILWPVWLHHRFSGVMSSKSSKEVHAHLGIGERSDFSFAPWELGESLKYESSSTHSQCLGQVLAHIHWQITGQLEWECASKAGGSSLFGFWKRME